MTTEKKQYAPHPLLIKKGEDPKPTSKPTDLLEVYALGAKDEDGGLLETVLASECPDFGAFREYFGPGRYEIVGRNLETRQLTGRNVLKVAPKPGEALALVPSASAPATPATAAAAPAVAPSRDQLTELLVMKLLETTSAHSSQMAEAIASLTKHRGNDMAEFFKAMMRIKSGGAGGSGGELAAFQAGMKQMLEFIGQAGDDDDGEKSPDTLEKLLGEFLQGAMRRQQEGPAPQPNGTPPTTPEPRH